MKASQLIIPSDIKVGFQSREDTYTGKLAYVVKLNPDGSIHKEKSWSGWRDHKIEPRDFKNEPTEGFVLNKKVGDYGGRWHHRSAAIRVYDPRGFEFEVTPENLLFILRECDCSRGKGLEGKFVYAWDKTELVLLPVSSADYANSQNFTKLQGQVVSAKDLVPGLTYTTKKQESWVYVGRFKYYFCYEPDGYGRKGKANAKGVYSTHVFWDGKTFQYPKDTKNLAVATSEVASPQFAELVDNYNKSVHGSKVTSLFLKESNSDKHDQSWYYQGDDGWFFQCSPGGHGSEAGLIADVYCKFKIEDGVMVQRLVNGRMTKPLSGIYDSYYSSYRQRLNWVEPTGLKLFAKHENGQTKRVTAYSHTKGY